MEGGSWKLEVGNLTLDVRRWKLEAGSCKMEVGLGGWKMEVESCKLALGSWKFTELFTCPNLQHSERKAANLHKHALRNAPSGRPRVGFSGPARPS